MKKILLLIVMMSCIFTSVQAQRLKKPGSEARKDVVEIMYESADYKNLKKLLAINDKQEALKLTEQLLRDYRRNDNYVCQLQFIAGNLNYASKNYATAYTHYGIAKQLLNSTDERDKLLQDAMERTLYQVNRKEPDEIKLPNASKVSKTTISEGDENPNEAQGFAIIENVPVYPSCRNKKNNNERKSCMSTEITKHVNANFNTSLANTLNLNGRVSIAVQFTISKDGSITNVYATSSQPNLEVEAIRVMNLLPVMQPGTQRGKPVNVIYGLPIIFQVQ